MKKLTLSAPMIIMVGFVITHLFFMLFVYRSNLLLHHNMTGILDAGYLAVPNEHIFPTLLQAGSAFKGSFFFTLTIGIVFPTLVYAAAWSWDRGYHRNRAFLIMLSGFVIFCMVMINRRGFNPVVTFWFLTVYFFVFKLTLYSLEGVQTRLSPKRLLVHIAVLILIGAAWMVVPKGANFFTAVRDHILLTTSFGEKITSFYYSYSPYPTEAIKPLSKKQLKTFRIERESEEISVKRIEAALVKNDYLPVGVNGEADVVLHLSENGILSFTVNNRMVLRTEATNLMNVPGEVLHRVSGRSDRQEFTRRLLGFSVMYGLPVTLYVCLFGCIHLVTSHFFNYNKGFYVSAAVCLSVGLGGLAAFKVLTPTSIPTSELKQALQSENRGLRVAALRTISAESLDPFDFTDDAFIQRHASIPERLWWARSMAGSDHADIEKKLIHFLDDPYSLVQCKAYEALGRRGDRFATSIILDNIKSSRHWYVQGYAYQTLRGLGWKQTKSP